MKINYIVIPFVVFITALSGSWLTNKGMSWYKIINIPSWTPPGSVIGMVWTVLFILTAISVLIFWNSNTGSNVLRTVAIIFILNAFLNVFWSYLFFYKHLIGFAVVEAVALGLSVVALVILIWPVSIIASALLIPYAGWVFFASYLTYSIWRLN